MNLRAVTLISSAALLSAQNGADAHVTFSSGNAYAGSSYIATAVISHGCEVDGIAAKFDTYKVEVEIPAGMTGVRPEDATFGKATVETDGNGNVTRLIWVKANGAGDALPQDDHFYRVSFRGKLPNTPLQSLSFRTVQTCQDSPGHDVTTVWEGSSAPKLPVLSVRAPGWNKYTAQSVIDAATIRAFFSDAQIVWCNGAAYSANTVTAGLIANPLTGIPQGAEYWVKY